MNKKMFFALFAIIIGLVFASCNIAKEIIASLFGSSGSSSQGQGSATAQTSNSANNTRQSQNSFQATHKVVTNDGTNLRLRNAPGFNTSQIGSLEYGSSVRVLDTGASAVDSDGYRGNWTYVTTPDGRTGWCFGAYLQILPQQSVAQQPQTNNSQPKTNSGNTQQNQQRPATQNNSQQIIDVNLYTLLSEWDDNNLRAKQLYDNKTIRMSGEIYNIYTDGSIQLSVSSLEYLLMSNMMMGINTTFLMVYFNRSEAAKLINLSREQSITVRGVYDGDWNVIRNAVIEPRQ